MANWKKVKYLLEKKVASMRICSESNLVPQETLESNETDCYFPKDQNTRSSSSLIWEVLKSLFRKEKVHQKWNLIALHYMKKTKTKQLWIKIVEEWELFIDFLSLDYIDLSTRFQNLKGYKMHRYMNWVFEIMEGKTRFRIKFIHEKMIQIAMMTNEKIDCKIYLKCLSFS